MFLEPTAAKNKKAKFFKAYPFEINCSYRGEAKASKSVRGIPPDLATSVGAAPTGGEYYHEKNTAPTISKIQTSKTADIIKIQLLNNFELKQPIDAVVEPDGDGFIARTIDIPLYGYGDDRVEAITALKKELESLYEDLMEDDQFSNEWLNFKKFLKERIAPLNEKRQV